MIETNAPRTVTEATIGAVASTVELEGGFPNELDCEHGNQRGKCEICDLKEELAEQVGAGTNPRYLLWRVWHGDNPSMRLWDYTAWSNKRWTEFCAEAKRNRRMLSPQDHADYDAWLRHWVRREIAQNVTYASAF